jgi:hypothetical protein
VGTGRVHQRLRVSQVEGFSIAQKAGKSRIPWPVWAGLAGLVQILAGAVVSAGSPNTTTPAARPAVTGQAKLTVDRDQIDSGRVPIGKPITASLKLTNVGDKPLQIEGQPAVQVLKGC